MTFVGRKLYLDSGIVSAAFMILSCILLRKIDSVVVSGFGAPVGLGRFGEIWALATDAKTETHNTQNRFFRTFCIGLLLPSKVCTRGSSGRAERYVFVVSR